MNFNFFDWIRDGVRRSVLLGVSDAVEQIGMPHDDEEAQNKVLSFLQQDNQEKISAATKKRISGTTAASTRKLGRSISDIHPGK